MGSGLKWLSVMTFCFGAAAISGVLDFKALANKTMSNPALINTAMMIVSFRLMMTPSIIIDARSVETQARAPHSSQTYQNSNSPEITKPHRLELPCHWPFPQPSRAHPLEKFQKRAR